MADYIDREETLKHLMLLHDLGGKSAYFAVRTDDIRKIPAADVAPVVYAEWIYDHATDEPRCSECGKDAINGEITPYCPHCGAMMSGGESDG